MPKPACHWSDK